MKSKKTVQEKNYPINTKQKRILKKIFKSLIDEKIEVYIYPDNISDPLTKFIGNISICEKRSFLFQSKTADFNIYFNQIYSFYICKNTFKIYIKEK